MEIANLLGATPTRIINGAKFVAYLIDGLVDKIPEFLWRWEGGDVLLFASKQIDLSYLLPVS